MSKHTPGPWKAVYDHECCAVDVFEIAEVSHLRVIHATEAWPTHGAPEDDARLIAAAPELLAALSAFLTYFGMDEDARNKPVFDVARAAIAKATT